MRYFYSPMTCSLAGMAALELTGAEYEPVEVALAGDRAALRAASGGGKVPILVADGRTISDTVAILYWLGRRYPATRLLPDGDDATARTLARLAWFGNVFHIVRRRFARPQMFVNDPAAHASVRELAATEYVAALREVETWIGDADRPMAEQVYALAFYNWALMDAMPVADLNSYGRTVRRLAALAPVSRALLRHKAVIRSA